MVLYHILERKRGCRILLYKTVTGIFVIVGSRFEGQKM
jgi:hypothetical protein